MALPDYCKDFPGLDKATVCALRGLRGALNMSDLDLYNLYAGILKRVAKKLGNDSDRQKKQDDIFQVLWAGFLNKTFVQDVGLIRDFFSKLALFIIPGGNEFKFTSDSGDVNILIQECLQKVLLRNDLGKRHPSFIGKANDRPRLPSPTEEQLKALGTIPFPDISPLIGLIQDEQQEDEEAEMGFDSNAKDVDDQPKAKVQQSTQQKASLHSKKPNIFQKIGGFARWAGRGAIDKTKPHAGRLAGVLDWFAVNLPLGPRFAAPLGAAGAALRHFTHGEARAAVSGSLGSETKALVMKQVAKYRYGVFFLLVLVFLTSVIVLIKTSSINETALTNQEGLLKTQLCLTIKLFSLTFRFPIPNRVIGYFIQVAYFVSLIGMSYGFYLVLYSILSLIVKLPF